MLHDLAAAAIGLVFGLISALLIGAFTVRGELQLFRALIPNFVTKEYLNEALKHERHEMRGEVQKYGGQIEQDGIDQITAIAGRIGLVETRLRTVEITVARLTPKTKDESL